MDGESQRVGESNNETLKFLDGLLTILIRLDLFHHVKVHLVKAYTERLVGH